MTYYQQERERPSALDMSVFQHGPSALDMCIF